MALKKGDFIEIKFTGRIKGGKIFDSNIKEDLASAKIQGNPSGFVFAVDEGMFVKGVDKFLVGKELGEYNIELKPEDAFGKRNPKLIQMVPLRNFIESKMNPIPGAMFNFDGRLAKILTVSGGRVMVDFNNPIAGKEVEYKIIIEKVIDDVKQKVDALNDFFFRKSFESEVKGDEVTLKVPKGMFQFVEMFKEKYEAILGLKLNVVEVPKKE